ncbi:MAG: DUF885 domain-containing protein [Pseudomonadota bacterium]
MPGLPAWRAITAGVCLFASACGGPALESEPSAAEAPPVLTQEPAELDPETAFFTLAQNHASKIFALSPEAATRLGAPTEIAGGDYRSRLGDYGTAGSDAFRRLSAELLAELKAFPRGQLTGFAADNYDVFLNAYETAARRNSFAFGGSTPAGGASPQVGDTWAITPYLVTQLTGPHLTLPRMMQTQHPVQSAQDAETFIARLLQFQDAIDGAIATIQSDAAAGVFPPSFVLAGAIGGLQGFIEPETANHPIVKTFEARLSNVTTLTAPDRTALLARAAQALASSVYPAYGRLIGALEDLKNKSPQGAGVWRLGVQGADYYQFALNAYGAGGMSADEVHDLGLSEVTRISREMDTILAQLGLRSGTVARRLEALADRADAVFPNTDEGREALLSSLRQSIAEVDAVAPVWFATIPEQPVEVRRIPDYEEDSSPGGYYSGPSLDGSRPGIFWINLKDTSDSPKLGLKTLTFHETAPGHHFQISLQRALPAMPIIRNMIGYSEYAEGWALYGEALAEEMGLYANDPEGNLGRLQAELFRAARLVVDTGLHHKRWTRDQAIRYMVDVTGETEASMTREVERYAAVPGQACAYKLGMLRVQSLRTKAETALGDAFDIRTFHDAILLAGAMPMGVLDTRIDRWIDEQLEQSNSVDAAQ